MGHWKPCPVSCKTVLILQAAGYIRPLVSTVVVKDKEGFLAEVFDRSRCHGSETPQAFKYEVIKEAYESVSSQSFIKC